MEITRNKYQRKVSEKSKVAYSARFLVFMFDFVFNLLKNLHQISRKHRYLDLVLIVEMCSYVIR